jgi:hypothetical protein
MRNQLESDEIRGLMGIIGNYSLKTLKQIGHKQLIRDHCTNNKLETVIWRGKGKCQWTMWM